MLFTTNHVLRRPIELLPSSATVVNNDRLADARHLQRMELRFREEPVTETRISSILCLMPICIALGTVYVWALINAHWILHELRFLTRAVEGLWVLLLLLGVCGALAVSTLIVALAPSELSILWIWLTLLGGFGVVAQRLGQPEVGVGVLALLTVTALTVLRTALLSFHNEWLLSDPRVTKDITSKWQGLGSPLLWHCPRSLSGSAQRFRSFLRYGASTSQAAGVWHPSWPAWRRLAISVGTVGFVLASAAWISTTAAGAGPLGLVVSLISSGAVLGVVGIYLAGLLETLSHQLEIACEGDKRPPWQQYAQRLADSSHESRDSVTGAKVYEAEHLFLGWEPWLRFPVLLHKAILPEHVSIVGRSGSGKTSMGLMQLLIQLIRGSAGTGEDPSPIVIIDLKGDEVMFQTARAEAEKRGQRFKFFTLEKDKASHPYNPFTGFESSRRSHPQMVQLILDSLGLNHGAGYGRGYFSQVSRFMLSEALKRAKGVTSFRQLYRVLYDLFKNEKGEFRNAFELLSVCELLTHYDQLITTPEQEARLGANTIQMDRVLEEREVVYFWLPSALESVSVREVGKLVLFTLRTAAQNRKDAGKEMRRVYLLIDECQKLAGENFQGILQQARSGGISVILANQAMSDLNTPDIDLRPTIRTNTRSKMFFSVSEPEELQMLSEFSGEELHSRMFDEMEERRPRLSTRELLAVSDHPKRLFLHVNGGSGYTQFGGVPIPVETDWPISVEVRDERASLPWPDLSEEQGGITASRSPSVTDESRRTLNDDFIKAMEGMANNALTGRRRKTRRSNGNTTTLFEE